MIYCTSFFSLIFDWLFLCKTLLLLGRSKFSSQIRKMEKVKVHLITQYVMRLFVTVIFLILSSQRLEFSAGFDTNFRVHVVQVV